MTRISDMNQWSHVRILVPFDRLGIDSIAAKFLNLKNDPSLTQPRLLLALMLPNSTNQLISINSISNLRNQAHASMTEHKILNVECH